MAGETINEQQGEVFLSADAVRKIVDAVFDAMSNESARKSGNDTSETGDTVDKKDSAEVEATKAEGSDASEDGDTVKTPEKLIGKVVAGKVDRFGNKISSESIANLLALASQDPTAFAEKITALMQGNSAAEGASATEDVPADQGAPAAEGTENGQSDSQGAEKGASGDGESGEDSGDDERSDKEADANANGDAEEGAEAAESGESEPKFEFTIEVLDPTSNVYDVLARERRGDIVRAMRHYSDASRKMIEQQLAAVEAKEREIKEQAAGEFATSVNGEGTDDEIARAAAAAGESSFKPSTDEDEEKRQKGYRQAMSDMAREAKAGRFDPKPEPESAAGKLTDVEYYARLKEWAEDEAKSQKKNRFGDPEVATSEHEKRVGGLFSKLKGRHILQHVFGKRNAEVIEDDSEEDFEEPDTPSDTSDAGEAADGSNASEPVEAEAGVETTTEPEAAEVVEAEPSYDALSALLTEMLSGAEAQTTGAEAETSASEGDDGNDSNGGAEEGAGDAGNDYDTYEFDEGENKSNDSETTSEYDPWAEVLQELADNVKRLEKEVEEKRWNLSWFEDNGMLDNAEETRLALAEAEKKLAEAKRDLDIYS